MRVFLVLSGVVVVLYLLGQWALRAGPARVAYVIRWLAVIAGLLVLLFFGLRGGAGLVLPLLVLLLPVLLRWRQLWHLPSSSASTDTKFSTVETRFLRVSLDHASGKIWGTVLAGCFANRELGDLTLDDLLELWRECQGDAQSVAVLEAYLDRICEEDWRTRDQRRQHKQSSTSESGAMSLRDAYEILGLAPGASREEIKAAHRRLMQRVHPDHGGSGYLASRVNRAKDVLLSD